MSLNLILDFFLGDVTNALLRSAVLTLAAVLFFATLLDIFRAKEKREAFIQSLKEIFAYFVFVVAAHRLDVLAVDRLFDWKGSSEYLVILWLIVREGKPLLMQVAAWAKVLPPDLLIKRLEQIETGRVSDGYIDSRDLELKIQNLRENLDKLREYNQLKQQAENLGLSAVQSPSAAPAAVPEPAITISEPGPTGPTL